MVCTVISNYIKPHICSEKDYKERHKNQCFDCRPIFYLAKTPFMLRKQMIQQLKSPPGWLLKSTVLNGVDPPPTPMGWMGSRTRKLPPASPAGTAPSGAPEWLWLHTHLPLPVARGSRKVKGCPSAFLRQGQAEAPNACCTRTQLTWWASAKFPRRMQDASSDSGGENIMGMSEL